jgi:hypothetical protein
MKWGHSGEDEAAIGCADATETATFFCFSYIFIQLGPLLNSCSVIPIACLDFRQVLQKPECIKHEIFLTLYLLEPRVQQQEAANPHTWYLRFTYEILDPFSKFGG